MMIGRMRMLVLRVIRKGKDHELEQPFLANSFLRKCRRTYGERDREKDLYRWGTILLQH